jgi:hypothetical protein
MRWDGDERDGGPGPGRSDAAPSGAVGLRAVADSGSLRGTAPGQVRLLREFKGLRVEDLLSDEQLVAALPGRVLRALEALDQGDLATADREMPGALHPVLPGPRPVRARGRHLLLWLVALFLVLGVVVVLARS